jgi:hypothetical protein
MYIVAIGWLFVVGCMAIVEAMSSSIGGALVTFFGFGVLPLALFLWLVGAPQRRRQREGWRAQRSGGASFTPGRRDDDE